MTMHYFESEDELWNDFEQEQRLHRSFDRIEQYLDRMNQCLDRMGHGLDSMDRHLDGIDGCLDRIEAKIDKIDAWLLTQRRVMQVATVVMGIGAITCIMLRL